MDQSIAQGLNRNPRYFRREGLNVFRNLIQGLAHHDQTKRYGELPLAVAVKRLLALAYREFLCFLSAFTCLAQPFTR